MSEEQESVQMLERRGITKVGVVTSNKMTKTVVVKVESHKAHPVYQRTVRRTSKFMAHDAENRCQIGDRVVIIESRPLSRHKRWRVKEILSSAAGAAVGESKS